MVTEAFALSPISARAATPNEADYDAIREAFMETARGRWFLGEYARRNRNADTSMVLDAVARIEETLAAQRQPVVEDRLPEALVAIRRAVAEAEEAAGAAFDRAALEASVGPIDRGVRIIREISWRWREIGADGRICDLIDSQLTAIEGACAQISALDPRAELKAAFDLLKDRIAQTDAGEAAPKQAASAPPAPAQEAPEAADAPPANVATVMAASEVLAAGPEDDAVAPETAVPETAVAATGVATTMDPARDTGAAETADDQSSIAASAGEAAAFAETIEDPGLDAAAEAEDDAILERIALEMAAPDPEFDEAINEPTELAVEVQPPVAMEPASAGPVAAEPVRAEPAAADAIAQLREAIGEAAVPVIEQPAPDVAQVTSLPLPLPVAVPEPSLGATILASGLLQKPRPANDPLAPIRRMTQAEKIAFFS